ncbi:MAG: DUF881 domain-containing protein [Longispora sp.]|nr:DUF881 domain-containing protein [Longispora sp. (in: high G+C Gram-positive bacteria)]
MSTPSSKPSPGQQFGGDLLTEIFDTSLDPGYVEASQRGKRATIWGLVGRVMALGAIGFLLAVAYLKVDVDAPEATKARQQLVSDVRRNQSVADDLETRAGHLRDEVAQMRDQALSDAGGDATHLRNLEALTGLGKVSGSGITVTVGDADNITDPVTGRVKPASLGKIYDRDLQKIVNAVWSVGAEAITINDQRIANTSAIRKAGDAILVDFRPVSSPYRIVAIGPDDMQKQFDATPTARQFRSYISQYGMNFDVKEHDPVTLPAAGDPQLRFATPAVVPPVTPGGSR